MMFAKAIGVILQSTNGTQEKCTCKKEEPSENTALLQNSRFLVYFNSNLESPQKPPVPPRENIPTYRK